jgi:hypothetical protein
MVRRRRNQAMTFEDPASSGIGRASRGFTNHPNLSLSSTLTPSTFMSLSAMSLSAMET